MQQTSQNHHIVGHWTSSPHTQQDQGSQMSTIDHCVHHSHMRIDNDKKEEPKNRNKNKKKQGDKP